MKRRGRTNLCQKFKCIIHVFFVFGLATYLTIGAKNILFYDYHERYVQKDIKYACALPNHNPFDATLMQYFWDPGTLLCKPYPKLLFLNSTGCVQLNMTYIKHAGIELKSVTCKASQVLHDGDGDVKFSSSTVLDFYKDYCVTSDLTRIQCQKNVIGDFFDELFYFTTTKEYVDKKIKIETESRPSVIMFALDSVSNLMSKRKLPLTVKYLTENLNAFEFRGYTKLGENTFPNLMPMLTGDTVQEEKFYNDKYLENVHDFVWDDFSKNGYATYYSEDEPLMPNFFGISKGFQKPPVDYYSRPFFVAIHKHLQSYLDLIKSKTYDKHLDHCFHDRSHLSIQIDMLKQFIEKYKRKRKFALSWHQGLSHNDANYLTFGDIMIKNFFQWMKENGHLNNTILFLLSDHGSNINAIRNTPVGRTEERMPMLYIVIPESMNALKENIQWNSKLLTTHFDTFQVLKEIATGATFNNEEVTPINEFGRSYFLEKIPSNRSCSDAKIYGSFCPCYKQNKLDINSSFAKSMADKVINYVQAILYSHSEICDKVSLKSIKDFQELTSNYVVVGERHMSWKQKLYENKRERTNSPKYVILIETFPGNALFEATLEANTQGDFQVIEPVLRANAYGNQPHCMKVKSLKPFCFCKQVKDA